MTEALAPLAGLRAASPAASAVRVAAERRLKRRYAAEQRFKWYGRLAIILALSFLAVLLTRIVGQGYTAFWTHSVTTQVRIDPARVDRSYIEGTNFDQMIAEAVLVRLGGRDDPEGLASGQIRRLLSPDLGLNLLVRVRENPSLIGRTVTVGGAVSDEADFYFKGGITREQPEGDRPLSNQQLDTLDRLQAEGLVRSGFNTTLFTRTDSTQPEIAGLLGAVIGSALTILVAALLAVPVGVLAALYLEEFSPRNRLTQFIEVNINNLAAVPSIVYGLLGVAVILNTFGLPRASPLAGGMVLSLMAMPTVIIATRSALKAVPPSIREAAFGVGASRSQAVFHHVLPLAMPGVMTGAILALAKALGETAPLLLIGMVAFTPSVPSGPTDAATVLPVQIFLWNNASERGFEERTAAAILVLLLFMICMNALAITLRRRFERRW
ncbi:MAG: phosphate ABC transporter permease PstA [Proteobacteria bacterium]|nr:phosphate ABC transporter permease PstA [Pseudomonadota bacterium]